MDNFGSIPSSTASMGEFSLPLGREVRGRDDVAFVVAAPRAPAVRQGRAEPQCAGMVLRDLVVGVGYIGSVLPFRVWRGAVFNPPSMMTGPTFALIVSPASRTSLSGGVINCG